MKTNTITALKKIIKGMVKEEVKRQLSNKVSAKDVHHAAEEVGMEWDNDENFMSLSKSVTGKEHIDDMTSEERSKLISFIKTESATKGETDDAEFYQGPEGHYEIMKYVNDPVLNKLLNETRGNIPIDAEFEAYPTMGGGAIDSQEKFYQQRTVLESAPVGTPRANTDIPDFMQKAMSGHFKKVIDKIEEKHGTRGKEIS
tara:strand:- start:3 stop:602 length:600 start_codon:yes stop_codon:yes gene_type:complete